MNYKSNSHWFFSKEQVLKHYSLGIELKLEVAYRRASAAFIQDVGIKLKMPQLTIATAISYFHRFFIRHQLKDHDRFVVATACLFLAGKVEETPRKLDDVIKVSYMIKNKKKDGDKMVAISQQEHNNLKNKILQNEHLILTTIAFELAVEHPYKYLLEYMKSIQGSKNLCQVAWNFVNDSLRTSLCLHYPPDLISYASIYLATRFLNYQLITENKKEWWEMLGIKFEVLEDISKQILDLYEANPLQQTATIPSSFTSTSTTTSTSSPSPSPNPSQPQSQPLPQQNENSNNSNNNNNNNNNNNTTTTSTSSNTITPTTTTTSTSSSANEKQPSLNESGDINKTPNKSLSATTANSISHHISPKSSNRNSDHRYSPYKSTHHSNSNKRSLSRSPSPNRASVSN
ncbi:hypothetical protein ACTFIZ_011216 [Dictyostelium cf. discoideum]